MRLNKIIGAREAYGAATVEQIEALQRRHVAKVNARFEGVVEPAKVHRVTETIRARVDWGRWLVDCVTPDCHNGACADPKTGKAWCFTCGAIYTDVEFPGDREELEDVLLKRPRPLRNARPGQPGEAAADHRAENRRRGIGGGS